MFSEKIGKKVDLLKPNHLMQESGAAEDLKKARKLKEDAILKLIYRAEAKVSKSSERQPLISATALYFCKLKSEWNEIM